MNTTGVVSVLARAVSQNPDTPQQPKTFVILTKPCPATAGNGRWSAVSFHSTREM